MVESERGGELVSDCPPEWLGRQATPSGRWVAGTNEDLAAVVGADEACTAGVRIQVRNKRPEPDGDRATAGAAREGHELERARGHAGPIASA